MAIFIGYYLNAFSAVKSRDINSKYIFENALEFLEIYEADEQGLICLFYALYIKRNTELFSKYNLEDTISWVKKGISISNGELWSDLPALLKYNLAYPLGICTDFYQGIKLIEEVKLTFQQSCNLYRIISCLNNESILLICCGFYRPAIQKLNGILCHTSISAYPTIASAAENNLILAYVLNNEFDQALTQMSLSIKNSSPAANCVWAPYCLYRLSKTKEALQIISKFDKDSLTKDDIYLFRLLRAVIRIDRRAINNVINPFLNCLCSQYNWTILMIFLRILCCYFEEENDYENLSIVLKARLDCKEQIFPTELPLVFRV